MEEIVESVTENLTSTNEPHSLVEIAQGLLVDTRSSMEGQKVRSVPISELSTLGAGVASIVPELNTITQTTTVATDGLYRLANAKVGDTLKVAKNGNFWGAFHTADGASKFAQLQEVGDMSVTTQSVAALNPATMMMAVALFSIEQDLGRIEETQQQILSFLEVEKESEIEADVEMLLDTIRQYKMNWNNERYVASHHQLVIDIQGRARKNMLCYQKTIVEATEKKQLFVANNNVNQIYNNLQKKFQYYRLSLSNFSLASMLEIMLSGNFNEEYISNKRDEIILMSDSYRNLFNKSSIYLEKIGSSAIDTNILKGVGTAENAIGKFVGNIPLVKAGPVDELLQKGGTNIKKHMLNRENKVVRNFSSLGNPETSMAIAKMDDMIEIYNHTDRICFDAEKVYLIENCS